MRLDNVKIDDSEWKERFIPSSRPRNLMSSSRQPKISHGFIHFVVSFSIARNQGNR